MWKLIACLWLFATLQTATKASTVLEDYKKFMSRKTKDKNCDIRDGEGSNAINTTYRCYDVRDPYLTYYPSLDNITLLDLTGNFSRIVIGSDFDKVETLVLSSRNLEVFHFSALKYVPRLKRIKFQYSSIGRIRADGVESMGNLKALEFVDSNIGNIGIEGFTAFPALEEFTLQFGEFPTFSFTMLPTTTKSLSFYDTGVQIAKSTCDIFKRFSLLESLSYIRHYKLLETIDFACLPSTLRWLNLNENREIRFVNLEVLESFPNLQHLDLSYNKNIRTFNISALPSSIKELAIDNNLFLIKESLPTSITCGQVNHLTNLSHISLVGNKMSDIDLNCIPENVQVLHLSHNQVPAVSCAGLKALPKLTELFLNDNRIEEFDFGCLVNEQMNYLKLSSNKIKSINLKSLSHLPHLDLLIKANEINCSCTFLTDFYQLVHSPNNHFQFRCYGNDRSEYDERGECVSCNWQSQLYGYPFKADRTGGSVRMSLPELKKFDNLHEGCLLTGATVSDEENEFQTGCGYEKVFDFIPKIACKNYHSDLINYYPAFKHLESLDVRGHFRTLNINTSYENLTHIKLQSDNFGPTFHFSSLGIFSKLAFLDLSDNQIQTVYTKGIPTDLRKINLNNNLLASLGWLDASLTKCSFLKELYLSHNKLTYFDLIVLPWKMRKLYLSHNAITDFYFSQRYLFYLEVIDLSWNALSHFSFDEMDVPNLEELVLDHNNLLTITSPTKLKFIKLHLSIKHNTFICNCNFFVTYTTTLAPITRCSKEDCFACRSDSELIHYPWWSSNVTQLEDYNKINNNCSSSNGTIIRASFMLILVAFVLNCLPQ